jgi:hypothetical protein
MGWLERRIFNYICPKSLILYAEKRTARPTG